MEYLTKTTFAQKPERSEEEKDLWISRGKVYI